MAWLWRVMPLKNSYESCTHRKWQQSNKCVYMERWHTLSFLIQSPMPSGDAQLVRLQITGESIVKRLVLVYCQAQERV
jgi:hypothetical protein